MNTGSGSSYTAYTTAFLLVRGARTLSNARTPKIGVRDFHIEELANIVYSDVMRKIFYLSVPFFIYPAEVFACINNSYTPLNVILTNYVVPTTFFASFVALAAILRFRKKVLAPEYPAWKRLILSAVLTFSILICLLYLSLPLFITKECVLETVRTVPVIDIN